MAELDDKLTKSFSQKAKLEAEIESLGDEID